MNEEYLWDGTGEADSDVADLEKPLERFRWSGKPLVMPSPTPVVYWYQKRQWAIAAAALVAIGSGCTYYLLQSRATGALTTWQLSRDNEKPSAVRSGEVIETGSHTASMESESVGEVEIAPDSRLRVLAAHADQHRLALDHGTIRAFIWAPPAKFVVDTPTAKTVDLGCKYSLTVEKDGTGFLQVELGWVAFEWHKIESFIPQGAACFTRVGRGPETPYFLDAPRALRQSLIEFDATADEHALRTVLKEARPRDGLTLWHLLERTRGEQRSAVYGRFAELVKLPPDVSRDGMLSGDQKNMDAAWNALQLGETGWWREWKRNW